jgi:putative ABC transport system permease protein
MPDWTSHIRVRLASLRLSSTREHEIIEELSQHLDDRWRELVAGGASEDEATKLALDGFRDKDLLARRLAPLRQACASEALTFGAPANRLLGDLWQDLRYAWRVLWQSPGFTVAAASTLALGIGANTAIFSVVNAVLLRPLPYPDSERLAYVYRMQPPVMRSPVSVPAYVDFAAQQQVFETLAAHYGDTFNLTDVDDAERIIGRQVTANFFEVFKVRPERGRFFLPTDDAADSAMVVVISDGLWRRRFGGDDHVVGTTITLNGEARTIVGVAPPQFQFPSRVEIWTPARLLQLQERTNRGNNFLWMIGRLKADVPQDQAQAQMNQFAATLGQQYPVYHDKLTVLVAPMLEEQVGGIRTTLGVLLGAVAVVLLIACANVTNLLLARASARRRELAIRVALGAARFRVVRQILTESLLLAFLGGAAGILLAFLGVRLLVALAPANLPRVSDVGIDLRVLGFTLLMSLLAGSTFGLAAAWRVREIGLFKTGLNETLKEHSRGRGGGSLSQAWLRRSLVIAEIALSLVLLVGAGLLISSFQQLSAVDPGFETDNLLAADINYARRPVTSYRQSENPEEQRRLERIAFLRAVEQKVAALPGIQSVGIINDLPVTGDNAMAGNFKIEGRPDVNWANAPDAEWKSVTTNYFNAIGVPLLKGRAFSAFDTVLSPPVILINETLARRDFPGEDPVGKRLIVRDSLRDIVGIVGAARQGALNLPARPEIYFPDTQFIIGQRASLVARTDVDPAKLVGAVRSAVHSIDPDAPISRVRSMQDVLVTAMARDRFNTTLMTLFAVLAMLLAAVGLYGVMAYNVAQRAQEIGVRIALGASRADVLRLVVRQGFVLVASGLALGVTAAVMTTRLMTTLLFEVSPTNPATFVVSVMLLTCVALLACWIPAQKATRVDPIVVLRSE